MYTSLSHHLVHVFELSFPAVLLLVAAEFEVGLFGLGVLANVYALTYGLGALPGGFLADRLGSKRLTIITFLGAALATALVGVSPSVWLLGLALALLGLATGLYHPAGFALISRAIATPGQAMGLHGVAGTLGVAVSPLLSGAVAAALGWRGLYIVLIVPAFLLVLALHTATIIERPIHATQAAGSAVQGRWQSALRPLLMIYGVVALTGFMYRGAITFLPTHLSARLDAVGPDPALVAGAATSGALLFGILGQLCGGWLSDRVAPEKLLMLVPLGLVPGLLGLGLFSGPLLLLGAIVYAFFIFFQQPLTTLIVARYTPYANQGSSFGILFFGNFGVGSFAAAFAGWLAERTGTGGIFLALAGMGLAVAALVGILLLESRRRAPAPVPAAGARAG